MSALSCASFYSLLLFFIFSQKVRADVLKLCDFGTSCSLALGKKREDGLGRGTTPYCAPEILKMEVLFSLFGILFPERCK